MGFGGQAFSCCAWNIRANKDFFSRSLLWAAQPDRKMNAVYIYTAWPLPYNFAAGAAGGHSFPGASCPFSVSCGSGGPAAQDRVFCHRRRSQGCGIFPFRRQYPLLIYTQHKTEFSTTDDCLCAVFSPVCVNSHVQEVPRRSNQRLE